MATTALPKNTKGIFFILSLLSLFYVASSWITDDQLTVIKEMISVSKRYLQHQKAQEMYIRTTASKLLDLISSLTDKDQLEKLKTELKKAVQEANRLKWKEDGHNILPFLMTMDELDMKLEQLFQIMYSHFIPSTGELEKIAKSILKNFKTYCIKKVALLQE
ncbi:uncharacterized protein KZ484_004061 isoform 1-T1 [Pholidichthys leucotaenia]